ncbi:cytochrome c-type biogenesis protein CcmH [Parahaliea mediterranea]|uniref:Cytochrome c-type biogenesis protein n=1 Tax=Parahaliea mediterranea TaxID=651086 RepID=A0A939DJ85_9GAMM|nr:cytochrome c-type biogenesis protein [Parahaliea mediterranea]MBN7798973.1 cytochrome c-type biogenesis protein CcmH [Parahaliea mediterranea]
MALLLCSAWAAAVIETYEFSSPALEARYHALSQELRCPKCQNQNIADSNAPISQDLRRQLYQQLEAGASDEEILEYMVARYGEFVRYRPQMAGPTLILWAAPVLLLLVGVAIAVVVLRTRRGAGEQLSEAERKQLAELLERESDA